jgi:hypothetical protein
VQHSRGRDLAEAFEKQKLTAAPGRRAGARH